MKAILLLCLMGIGILSSQVSTAQAPVIKGQVVDAKTNQAMPGVTVFIKGTTQGVSTDESGMYSIKATTDQILSFSFLGYRANEVTIGKSAQINIRMEPDILVLKEFVITALGIKEEKKNLGVSVTEVKGSEISRSQRTNFVDALQGRVAGLTVNQSSGLPGASSSVVIRGISSLSGSNEPLYIVDGLPYNNKTFATNSFASAATSAQSLENRSVDFTNRGADINPEDIESVSVLKGPEATSLYGIDASNGAIVITTKRGKAGEMKLNYSNSISITKIRKLPEIQQVYGQGRNGILDSTYFQYYGEPYAPGTKLYDNISPFFQTGIAQKHNISFEGGSQKTQYRLSASYLDSKGIVPQTGQKKLNISSTIRGDISKYFNFDFTIAYTNDYVDRVFKSSGGPMIGLLHWPSRDAAYNYLNADGTRRQVVSAADPYENPYFNVNKNDLWSKSSRIVSGFTVNVIPTKWLKFVGKYGFDVSAEQNYIMRHPESNSGRSLGGIIDDAVSNTRNQNWEYYAMFNHKLNDFKFDFKMGGMVNDLYYKAVAGSGEGFLDPNFASLNNIPPDKQRTRSTISQRRIIGAFGIFTVNYKSFFNLQLSERMDWSSTLPADQNPYFYPAGNFALILTEIPVIKKLDWLSFAKIRGGYAIVRKDPPPYGVFPALETQVTTGGGYAYGFTGPNPLLKPEKTTSYEGGLELMFFKGRLGLDATYYKKESVDQIVKDLRLSYATGYVLSVMNGGSMWNKGIEIQLKGAPISNNNLRWDIIANFNSTSSKLTYLPTGLKEYYNSDTWFYGNVRNGAIVGQSTSTISGLPYERNAKGDILINPQTGLPLRLGTFGAIGDRNPDFTLGITNSFTYKNFELTFLLDIRKGGDVLNLTEHQMVLNGLSVRTLDREKPVVIKGVLKDGFQETDRPTQNNVQILPSRSGASYYYTTPNNGLMNEEDFVEHNIKWLRLKDVTLAYTFPKSFLEAHMKAIKSLSIYGTATDLFLITNYRGLDPVIMGNNAAVSGSGSAGMDYGNFPLPMGLIFGIKVGF